MTTNPRSQHTLRGDGGIIVIKTGGYDAALVDDIHRLAPRARYSGSITSWSFPTDSVQAALEIATRHNIEIPPHVAAQHGYTVQPKVVIPSTLTADEVFAYLRFPTDPRLIARVKQLPGVGGRPHDLTWRTPIVNLEHALRFAEENGFQIQEGLKEQVAEQQRIAEERMAASKALDADIDIPSALPLLPYQRAGVKYLMATRRSILGDEMGLGKTVQALATCMWAGCERIVVVTKSALKLNWGSEIEKFYPGTTYTLVDGTTPGPIIPARIVVLNYDIVDQRADDVIALNPTALIADESHRIKNGKPTYKCPECGNGIGRDSTSCSLQECGATFDEPKEVWTVRRTNGVMRISRAIPNDGYIFMLTGTPITNRPAELIPQLIAIRRMDDFGGQARFTNRYCPGGTGARNLVELNQLLRQRCFVRRTNEDVRPELPSVRHAPQVVQVERHLFDHYQKIEADVIEFLARRAAELAAEMGEDPMSAYWEKRMRAEAAEHLVRISVLKDAVSEMKLQAQIDWIKAFLDDTDQKVIVFAEHIKTVESVYEAFRDQAVKIRGGMTSKARKEAEVAFQGDPKIRVFVGNMESAGEGLTLTMAHHVVFLEQAWTPALHDQCVARCYGRANDAHGATAYWLLAPKTIDVEINELLAKKKRVVDAATDGREIDPDDQGSILGDLLVSLARRGLAKE